jgi:hypothetical protein
MVVAAARIDSRLIAAIKRIDSRKHPIAETNRRVGAIADRLGLPRPSYEQTRVHVHALRHCSSADEVDQLLLELTFRTRARKRSATRSSRRRALQATVCYLGLRIETQMRTESTVGVLSRRSSAPIRAVRRCSKLIRGVKADPRAPPAASSEAK